MQSTLTELTPRAYAHAIEANLCENYEYFCSAPGTELQAHSDMVRFITGVYHANLNGVIRSSLTGGNLADRIDDTLAHFRARGLPMIWWTGPSTTPVDLGMRLVAHGLHYSARLPGMACDLHALNEDLASPSSLRISRVRNRRQLAGWVTAFARGFDTSPEAADGWYRLNMALGLADELPWRLYAGYVHGQPVATAALHLGAGVAGIYCVSTIPSARRQGIGAALVVAALRDAREEGCRVGILHSSELGMGVYRRLGFQEYCSIGAYSWSGEETRAAPAEARLADPELVAR